MKTLALCFLLAMTASLNGQGQATTYERHPAIAGIDRDFADGKIDVNDYIRQQFYVVFDPAPLNSDYRRGLELKIKCATPLIMRFNQVKARLDSKTVEAMERYLDRPMGPEAVYISPSGRFQLTYVTTGGNAVPATDINPANGIPDYVERCAEYFDYSWRKEIDTLGFAGPYNSETRRYQISFENMGAYGYTTTTGDSVGTRIVVHNNFIGFPPNDDPDGDVLGAMKVTNAHEFKHASQFTNSQWSENGWVELDATWMEDIAYDATNDYYNYIVGSGSPFTAPGTALDDGGSGSYEDCNWQHFMSEKYGNAIITDLWNYRKTHQWEDMLASYDNILISYGSSLAAAFKDYVTWNMMTGTRAVSGFGYGESSTYPTSTLCRTHTTLPASGTQCTLGHLAANFIRVNSDQSVRNLHVVFNGPVGEEMGLMLVFRHNAGFVTTEEVPLDAFNSADYIATPRLNGVQFAGLIPVMTQTYSGDFTYAYSLETVPGVAIHHTPLAGVVDSAAFYAVTAQMLSYGARLDTQNLFLHYGSGAITDSVLMISTGITGQFSADIPGPGNNVSVRYYLSAMDTTGYRVTLPAGAPGDFFEFSVGHDVIPPQIDHASPTAFSRDELPLSVKALVSDDVQLDTVTLAYRHNAVDLGVMGMQSVNGDTFMVVLPLDTTDVAIGDSIEYRITARDASIFQNVDSTEWYKVYVYGAFTLVRTITKPIPDNNANGVLDTLPALATDFSPAPHHVADMDVIFKATHPYIGDLTVKLKSPSGLTVTLMQRPGPGTLGSSGDNPDIVLDDEAETSIENITHTGSQQVVGRYRPDPQALSLFDGEDINGNWILQVLDSRSSQTGTLTQWGFKVKTIASAITDVPEDLTGAVPRQFMLLQNYPNPFNPSTTIRYQMAVPGHVTLTVYNILGQRIRTLVNGRKPAGGHEVAWDGLDAHGVPMSSGVYFYRLQTGGQSSVRKMVLVK